MYYEKNLESIKKYKEYLYKKMTELGESNKISTIDAIELVETRDGARALAISKENVIYRFNSIYSPSHEAAIWADQFDFKNIGAVFIMFGLGNGDFAKKLMKRLKEDSVLLIYEPSHDIFDYMINNSDISDIIKAENVSITVEGINDNEIKNLLMNYVNWLNLKSQIICIHPIYEQAFSESARTFFKIIQDNNNRAVVNNNTDVIISRRIINNTLFNIKHLKKCNIVTDLIGKFPENVPAIIVSAGPSLDKNIEDLKAAKGKAVIFAVDTAMKYLLAHDIMPDFIVTLDPDKSLWHLQDERCKNIPLFCRIDSRTESIENNKKMVILYNLEGYAKTLLQRLGKNTGVLNSGGSVATGAFSICETLGFQRIILIGQDLAYSSNDTTHAGGVKIDVGGAGRFLEEVEDIYGNTIKTRYDWYVYIKWFEDATELFEGEEVIDATEGGAKIKGTTILTLKEAIEQYCTSEVACEKIIEELRPTLSSQECEVIYKLMTIHFEDINVIMEKAKEGIALCCKLIEKYERNIEETAASKLKNDKLSNINTLIEEKDIYELIDWDIAAATSSHMADIYTYTNDEKADKLSTYQKAKAIYEAIIESATRIKPMFEEGIKGFKEIG